jgi:hypothetical protein
MVTSRKLLGPDDIGIDEDGNRIFGRNWWPNVASPCPICEQPIDAMRLIMQEDDSYTPYDPNKVRRLPRDCIEALQAYPCECKISMRTWYAKVDMLSNEMTIHRQGS